MSALQIAYYRLRLRVRPGYARRWLRLNWWTALSSLLWAAAAIALHAVAAASRPEPWAVGGEIIPCVVFWALAFRQATKERRCITHHRNGWQTGQN